MMVLNEIFDRINKMNKKDIESQIFTDYDHQYQYFIAMAILLLLAEFSIIERRNKKIKGLNLLNKTLA
jgi:Ca-activated chloride channel family protein